MLELTTHVTVVGEAEDGADALVKIEQLKPEIALLDVQMPRKNGIEVVQA